MPDIAESVSRKIGPLPVWGWAIAVAGAVLGFRILSGGRSASPTTVGVSTVPGETGGSGDAGTAGTAGATGERGEQGEPGVIPDLSDLLDKVAGLSTGLTNATAFNTLQQRLNTALNTRATALYEIERWTRYKNDAIALYQDRKISKASYDLRMTNANREISTYTASRTTTDKSIADLQKQIAAIGATPA